tara:strand:+ start:120 stop:590 length:471 start_codon:yes stop_codon:yes gene_type:complete
MHIIGIGLPRTGTTSLAKFLRNLGFLGKNYCVIHENKINDSIKIVKKSFLIDNSAYRNYKHKLIYSKPETKFILTTRDKKSWKKSINSMKTKKLNIPKDLPDISLYHKEVTEFFKTKKSINRLLVIDLNNISQQKIYSFLEIENLLKIEYPKELIK